MIGNAREDIGEPSLRVDIVELGGLDQRVDGGSTLTAAVGAVEQPCLAAERDAAKGALGGIVLKADAAVVEEPGERIPALQHIEAGLDAIVTARQFGDLLGEPGVELVHQRRAEFLPNRESLGGALAVDAVLDVEQGVETLHGFERDRMDRVAALAPALLAGAAYDICQLAKLPPRMGKAAGFKHGPGVTVFALELIVAAIGIGLQDPGPCCKVGLRVLAGPIARVVEQGCWRIAPGKRPIIADVNR